MIRPQYATYMYQRAMQIFSYEYDAHYNDKSKAPYTMENPPIKYKFIQALFLQFFNLLSCLLFFSLQALYNDNLPFLEFSNNEQGLHCKRVKVE